MVKLPGSLLLMAQSSAELPPPVRAAAMMALLGIVLLGLLFIASILIGGHWVRRLGSHRRGSAVPPDFFSKKQPSSPDLPRLDDKPLDDKRFDGKPLDGETARIDDTLHS